MEIKKKLQKGLIGILAGSILAFSGCGNFTIGGQEKVDRRNYVFGAVGDNYASEEITKGKLKNPWDLTDWLISRGKYEEAISVIERTFREEGFERGKSCLDRAEEYVGFLSIKAKDILFLKNKYNVDKKEK